MSEDAKRLRLHEKMMAKLAEVYHLMEIYDKAFKVDDLKHCEALEEQIITAFKEVSLCDMPSLEIK